MSDFLKALHKDFELVIFTASLWQYAHAVIDSIDPFGFVKYRLHRDHCTFFNGQFIKDIS